MSRTLHHGRKARDRRYPYRFRPFFGYVWINGVLFLDDVPTPPKLARRVAPKLDGGNYHYKLHLDNSAARALSRAFIFKALKADDLDDLPAFPEIRKPMDWD